MTRFDYIVVGGGTAGCIVARRLAENPDLTVCLIEAGPSDEDRREVLRLARWRELKRGPLDEDHETAPQPLANDRIRHSRARILGGCSSHNTAIAFAAPHADLTDWARYGGEAWGPAGTAQAFARLGRQVPIERPESGDPLTSAFLEAAETAGFARSRFEAVDAPGVGWLPLNSAGGLRLSSSVAYLHPLAGLPANLTLLLNSPVTGLTFGPGNRVTGVTTGDGVLGAEHGVVLAAGAFGSPKLMLLSGIGPADDLRALGIPVRHDLPGVGANLLDHPEAPVTWEASQRPPSTKRTAYADAGLFARIDPGADAPDLMIHFCIPAYEIRTAGGGTRAVEGFSMTPNVARPKSRGRLTLRSADPAAAPIIDPAYLSDAAGADLALLVAGIGLCRDLAGRGPLARWIAREAAPGPAVVDRAALEAYIRKTLNTVYHPVGTCRLGPADDRQAVVGADLAVHGMSGLNVADASIFPTMIGVNPCLTCMMIGEKAAEILSRG